jgi:hypothetical protein
VRFLNRRICGSCPDNESIKMDCRTGPESTAFLTLRTVSVFSRSGVVSTLRFLCRRSRTFPFGRTGDEIRVPLQTWRSVPRAQARPEARPASSRSHKLHNGSTYHFAIRDRSMPRAFSSHFIKTRYYGFCFTTRQFLSIGGSGIPSDPTPRILRDVGKQARSRGVRPDS